MILAIVGNGAMGKTIAEQARKNKSINKVWTIEPLKGESLDYLDSVGKAPNIIIDFSHPANLEMILTYLRKKKGTVAAVIGTTGYTKEQEILIKEASFYAPIMRSSNYSYGINVVKSILGKISGLLRSKSDVSLIEIHHKNKIDLPSGTAIALKEEVEGCDREGKPILVSSIRAGNHYGEHKVIFSMEDEVVEISHRAYSKKIFANGAIEGALWMEGREPGFYTVEEMLYCGYKQDY